VALVERQANGSFAQALGAAFTVTSFPYEVGQPLTSRTESYGLLAVTNLDGHEIDSACRSKMSPRHSFGAKGIGEVDTIGLPGALADPRSKDGATASTPPSLHESVSRELSASKVRR
jgi:CO/xanthine dehydrogenase Mo-binding subunit